MLALLSANPAAADVTARYSMPSIGGSGLTVQVNSRGDSRISMGNQTAVITVGGVSYVLMADLLGSFAVKQEDLTAVMEQIVREMAGDPPATVSDQLDPNDPFTPVRAGTATVAGRTGILWTIQARFDDARLGEGPYDFLTSPDPDLAPVGQALARQFAVSTGGPSVSSGPLGVMGSLPRGLHSIIQQGTIIRMGRMLRLQSVETTPVPDSTFALPNPILTREQFIARTGLSAPQSQ